MNINDIQATNENIKVENIKNYNASTGNTDDFSSLVQVNNAQDVQNKEQNEKTDKNNEEQQLVDNTISAAFVQNFQMLNSELFNLGVMDNNKSFINDDFSLNINLSDLTQDDINLFQGLIEKTDLAVNSVNSQNQTINLSVNGEDLGVSYRSLEVSKTLFSAIDNAMQTGKPIRLDFGQDTSVILKISKDGKISADFIPNEKAMEAVLKNALPQLKAKFDEENLPYHELNYRQYNQQKDNQKEHKEKKDE